MTKTAEAPTTLKPKPGRFGRKTFRRVSGASWGMPVSVTVLALLIVGAAGAGIIRPDHYLLTNFDHILQPPSLAYPLGTDSAGRDLLAMILRGMRVSFLVSTMAAIVAVVVGAIVGLISGAIGGVVDDVLMRIVDFLSSQNHLLFGLFIAVLAYPLVGGAGAVTVSVGFTHWTSIARILRAEILSIRERPFVFAAIGLGAGRGHVIRHHLLPNILPSAGLGFVLLFPHAIFHEAALSFLGVGLPPGNPSLGTLISFGQSAMLQGGWWIMLFPGLVIVIASIVIGAIGEWWRDRAQPRWRSELEL